MLYLVAFVFGTFELVERLSFELALEVQVN